MEHAAVDAAGATQGGVGCDPTAHVVRAYDAGGAARILATHNATCGEGTKRFAGETLVYVTPWNGRGYDVAKRFGRKFTYVSPVWLQLRDGEGGGGPVVTGLHDVDDGWVAAVRAGCGGACAVVPRVIFEARSLDVPAAVAAIAGAVRAHGWDGVVLEAPLAHPAVAGSFVPALAAALRGLPSAALGAAQLVLVVGPGALGAPALAALAPHAHRFSVMTYDYSAHRGGRAGPNAPLGWCREVVDALAPPGSPARAQLLLGVPFYGYDTPAGGGAPEAILGGRWLQLLGGPSPPRVKLDAKAGEHYVVYAGADGGRRTAYYPTPHMLAARLALAAELGLGGVAIWEGGQGLDGFMDLL